MVRRLVDEQFPGWRALPVRPVVAAGTVNAIFRIGEQLAARFPIQVEDAAQAREHLVSEVAAARELATCSPVATPQPVALGEPGPGYPSPWSVQTWLPGRTAIAEDPAGSVAFAHDLSVFVARLRQTDTRGRRFSGRGRGGYLPDHDDWMQVCFGESEDLLDVARLNRLWQQLRRLPAAGPDVMSHGDLIPGNVLVRDGRLIGVLDGGGFGPADPALDLVSAWHLLDEKPRDELRRALDCGEAEWARGIAWALQQAMGLVWYYRDSNPVMSRIGERTLRRILAAT